jgi:mono/diheme cytochrome c family protein
MRNRSGLTVLVASLITTAGAHAQGGRGAPVQLPDGAGKDVVATTCVRCHGLNQIVNSGGYAADGWRRLIGSMVALPAEQAGVVSPTRRALHGQAEAMLVPRS